MTLQAAIRAIIGSDSKLHRYQQELLAAWEESRKAGKPVQWHYSHPAGMATVKRIMSERMKQLVSREDVLS